MHACLCGRVCLKSLCFVCLVICCIVLKQHIIRPLSTPGARISRCRAAAALGPALISLRTGPRVKVHCIALKLRAM